MQWEVGISRVFNLKMVEVMHSLPLKYDLSLLSTQSLFSFCVRPNSQIITLREAWSNSDFYSDAFNTK